MRIIFFSELGKLSIEYLSFNTITNIEYIEKFDQDKFFISIVLEMDKDLSHIQQYYNGKNNFMYNFNWKQKCLKSYGYFPNTVFSNYSNENDFDNDEIMYLTLICNNLTLDQIMDRNFFYDYYLNEGIDIQFKQFINSSRYSFGYLISPKIKNDMYYLKPVLTFQMKNVSYDHDNLLVSKIHFVAYYIEPIEFDQ